MIPPAEAAAAHAYVMGSEPGRVDRPMAEPVVVRCAWCRRIRIHGSYVEATPPAGARISDGICQPCRDRVFPAPAPADMGGAR